MNKRLGIIARMDKTGLGNQTRNLVEMLNPHKILVIDSTPFNKNKQYPSWYSRRNAYRNRGFIGRHNGRSFIRGIDVLLSCETFYSPYLIDDARQKRITTLLQYNWEFLENHLPGYHAIPDMFISPSYWHLEDMQSKYPNTIYLPPPTSSKRFSEARRANLERTGKPKLLHIVGKQAVNDRNGTNDLIEALKYTKADFELHVKSQGSLELQNIDKRIIMDYSNPDNEADLYKDYDALILPRRYAGLCLPMNEALMSALPVIMTDISPNNRVLPPEWLVPAKKKGEFMTKTLIDFFETPPKELAKKLDWLCAANLRAEKEKAFQIGYNNYSYEALKPEYERIINQG